MLNRAQNTLPNQKAYYEAVWALVRDVPQGQIVTYGQLAKWLSVPNGVTAQTYKTFGSRWVGHAMAACPADVPWQRVVNARGMVSDRKGAVKQRQLLEQEGVVFVKGKIDLKFYQWHGAEQDAIPRQARLF
ncbi:MAG: MGMT family protein [Candidatus Promineifilaceae bacterium]